MPAGRGVVVVVVFVMPSMFVLVLDRLVRVRVFVAAPEHEADAAGGD